MKKAVLIWYFCVVALVSSFAQNGSYKDPNLSPEERAEDLLGRLTLKEKIGLMQNSSCAIKRLGIAPYNWWSEALHGVARNGVATVFPITIGMAATFDDEVIERVYVAVSDEARAKFHDEHRHNRYGYGNEGLTFWSPNVNIFRDPRWGRGHETFGEDPYLTTRMGVSVVKGMQGPADSKYDKTHACAKHYAVHSGPEPKRHRFNVENLSPRDLWETYLPAFKALVQEADVKEVMCAYQRFEGEPCCDSNRLLTQILRDEWGYKHLVVSDCGAIGDFFRKGHHETHKDGVYASASAVINGTDLECGAEYANLEEAVKKGLITEERIDKSLRRLLEARFALGEMDPDSIVPWSKISIDTVDCNLHKQMSLDIARKSMVLLHNNGVLPLAKSGARIAVLGPNAVDSIMQWGNYNGIPSHTYTILEGIRGKVGDVLYEKGCDLLRNQVFYSSFEEISNNGCPGLTATYWNNMDLKGDVATIQQFTSPINLTNSGHTAFNTSVGLFNFTASYEGVFRPKKSDDYTLIIEGDDGYRVYVNDKKVIDYWGVHPSVKREYTLKATAGQDYKIKIEYMQAGGEALLKFDLGVYRQIPAETVVDKVKRADIVIFVGGISPDLEGEEKYNIEGLGFSGGDRTTIELPQVQRDILKALKIAGKKVIFVNCSGSAVALVPEMDSCDAILQAWYPGQAGGLAVADILFGDFNPSGKLPVTFYKNMNQLPDFENYSMKGRTYRYMTESPLFPFGYGLSYTTFDISKGRLNKRSISVGESVNFKVNVKNTGRFNGAEVIQVYVRKIDDKEGPVKSLRAFRRVPLKIGESRTVSIDLSPNTFEFFDPITNTMRIVSGKYEIMYGNSSNTPIENKLSITIQ
mgnify:FL=1